jgi:hypothetical protein
LPFLECGGFRRFALLSFWQGPKKARKKAKAAETAALQKR